MKLYRALQKGLCSLCHRRTAAMIASLIMVLTATAATEHAAALFILTGANDTAIILDGTTAVPEISSEMIDVSSGSRISDITLTSDQTVTITHNGETTTVQSNQETVSRLLKRLEIFPSPLETVAVDVSGTQVEITIDEEIIYYDCVNVPAAYETVRVPNPDMVVGTEQVVREGWDGVRPNIYEVIWSNGKELSRQLVDQLDSTAIDEIVEYGTAPAGREPISHIETNEDGSGTLYFPSGATLEFSSVKSMTATAYTAGHGGADYYTATGTHVQMGTVAVDKRVIPLGTRMYIVTDSGIVYGVSTAEDTGVRGNKVDLYYDTYEQCINFGRRNCSVYILK